MSPEQTKSRQKMGDITARFLEYYNNGGSLVTHYAVKEGGFTRQQVSFSRRALIDKGLINLSARDIELARRESIMLTGGGVTKFSLAFAQMGMAASEARYAIEFVFGDKPTDKSVRDSILLARHEGYVRVPDSQEIQNVRSTTGRRGSSLTDKERAALWLNQILLFAAQGVDSLPEDRLEWMKVIDNSYREEYISPEMGQRDPFLNFKLDKYQFLSHIHLNGHEALELFYKIIKDSEFQREISTTANLATALHTDITSSLKRAVSLAENAKTVQTQSDHLTRKKEKGRRAEQELRRQDIARRQEEAVRLAELRERGKEVQQARMMRRSQFAQRREVQRIEHARQEHIAEVMPLIHVLKLRGISEEKALQIIEAQQPDDLEVLPDYSLSKVREQAKLDNANYFVRRLLEEGFITDDLSVWKMMNMRGKKGIYEGENQRPEDATLQLIYEASWNALDALERSEDSTWFRFLKLLKEVNKDWAKNTFGREFAFLSRRKFAPNAVGLNSKNELVKKYGAGGAHLMYVVDSNGNKIPITLEMAVKVTREAYASEHKDLPSSQ